MNCDNSGTFLSANFIKNAVTLAISLYCANFELKLITCFQLCCQGLFFFSVYLSKTGTVRPYCSCCREKKEKRTWLHRWTILRVRISNYCSLHNQFFIPCLHLVMYVAKWLVPRQQEIGALLTQLMLRQITWARLLEGCTCKD